MKKNEVTTIEQQVNQHQLNIITPSGIDYSAITANVGDNYGRIYAITKYPNEADYGWSAEFCNMEGTSTCMEFRYTDSSLMTEIFDRRISELKSDRDIAKKESEKQQLDQAIKDLDDMIKRISVRNEPIGYVNTMLHIQDSSPATLNNRIKRVTGNCAVNGCNIRNLKFKQLDALKCMSPYGIPNREVSNIGARNMPISTFFGGFPMANSGINDNGGYFLGRCKNRRLVILNQWLRNKDRVNSNWFITGLPGVGKSTCLKTIFVKEFAYGTKIILFDPEEEYVDLAKHKDIQGDIIDCAGGTTGRINPLQIRVSPKVTKEDLDEGEELEDYMVYDSEHGESDMALHIQNLRVFFKLYFGSNEFDSGIRARLEECLVEVYKEKNITWDTDISKLKAEDFPILSELFDVITKKASDPNLSTYNQNIYDKLTDLMRSISQGADQFIWNGHTTINPKSNFIVLNTSKLLDLDENVKRAQFFNLTMWAWQQMAADRTEKVLFGVDEGYLFVDPDYPDLMKFLRNISKRDRKYEGGLMFITHSVVDVLDPAVKRFGQALIDNACYKFIMGCDGKNLQETKKLFNLTEKEENILASKTRGKGILFAGSVRIDVSIEVRESMLAMFGKAGGR